jgi:hypothetical protein
MPRFKPEPASPRPPTSSTRSARCLSSPPRRLPHSCAILPVEFDASFNRALVVLKHGRFVPENEMGAARHILSAAAYTYVAAALTDLINLPRLLRGLRL